MGRLSGGALVRHARRLGVDVTLDALVAEALRPRQPDLASIASVRALTDVTMWRALRDQGATPAASVEQASSAVERWLEARPAGA